MVHLSAVSKKASPTVPATQMVSTDGHNGASWSDGGEWGGETYSGAEEQPILGEVGIISLGDPGEEWSM